MRKDNEQFVSELMTGWCPTGPMSQVFIIEAIRRYAEEVANAPPIADTFMLSGAVWKATGQHIHELMTKRLDSSADDEVTDSSSAGPRFLAVVDFDDCDNQYGMFCPSCGHSDEIDITANVDVRLTYDGTDADESADGSHNWDDDTPCSCANCGHSATVADFTPDEDDMNREDVAAD